MQKRAVRQNKRLFLTAYRIQFQNLEQNNLSHFYFRHFHWRAISTEVSSAHQSAGYSQLRSFFTKLVDETCCVSPCKHAVEISFGLRIGFRQLLAFLLHCYRETCNYRSIFEFSDSGIFSKTANHCYLISHIVQISVIK